MNTNVCELKRSAVVAKVELYKQEKWGPLWDWRMKVTFVRSFYQRDLFGRWSVTHQTERVHDLPAYAASCQRLARWVSENEESKPWRRRMVTVKGKAAAVEAWLGGRLWSLGLV